MNKIYDVIIVGAGPVGLATAIGLRKRGINNILVVDQTSSFRRVGQIVDLLPNGLKALKYVDADAYEAVLKASLTFADQEKTQKKHPSTSREWVVKNFEGQKVRSISLDFNVWLQKYGEGRVSISWYNLQSALRKLLPEEQVKPNHRCVNIVDEPELRSVRLDCICNASSEENPYAHWVDQNNHNDTLSQNSNSNFKSQQSVTKSFRSKLIVAADGINSTARRIIYPNRDSALPEYSGFAAISCMEISNIPEGLRSHLEEKFFTGSPISTVSKYGNESNTEQALSESPRITLVNRSSTGYFMHLPIELNLVQEKSGNDLLNLALQELQKAGFPDEIKELVRLSPLEKIQQRPYHIHHARTSQNTWSAGRVVLLGDAAHGMPPFMAQGANQGFEDALVMATLVNQIAKENNWDNKQAIVSAFEKYERSRRPFMEYIQQATLTLFPQLSDQAWQEYSQKVYARNFDEINAGVFTGFQV